MFQQKASKRYSLTSMGFAFAQGEVTPARCRLMVGPNQSQFELLSAPWEAYGFEKGAAAGGADSPSKGVSHGTEVFDGFLNET